MNKITRLESVRAQVDAQMQYFLIRLLRPEQYDFTQETYDEFIQHIGRSTLLMAEIDDHCQSLRGMEAACRHGLAGTAPTGFPECGYDFTQEIELPDLPYDPYTDVLGHLHGGSSVACHTLSAMLLSFIDLLPEAAAARAEELVAEGVLRRPRQEGRVRLTDRTRLWRIGNRAVLKAVDTSLFAAAYAPDMARIRDLATHRGDFQQILDLLN